MPSLMFKTKVRLLNGPEWICTRCCYCTFATQIKGTHKRRRHRGQLTMKKQLSNSQLKYIVLYLLLNVNLCLAYTNKVPYIVKTCGRMFATLHQSGPAQLMDRRGMPILTPVVVIVGVL